MKRFPKPVAAAIDGIKYFRIRAGNDHRFIAIWVVVVDGRVLVRPWNDKPGGWYGAFLDNPKGTIQVHDKAIPVRAAPVEDSKLLDAMDVAYGKKYTTKPNQSYVKGFGTAKRRATTLELTPVSRSRP